MSDSKIKSGNTVRIVVYGNDDDSLDWISWEGEDAGERALDRENRFDCNGRTSCAQSWTLRVTRTGLTQSWLGQGDKKGLKSEPAYAGLRVRTAALTTPSRNTTVTVKR